jgi:hypothetical protein
MLPGESKGIKKRLEMRFITARNKAEIFLQVSKKTGLKVKTQKTKYISNYRKL